MKRILSLILCAALCLSLTACGGGNGGGNDRSEHDYLLGLLDEHKYTEAVDYINRLAYDYAEQNKGEQPDSPHLPALSGEWIPYSVPQNEPTPPTFTFTDGRCTVEGKEYLMELSSANENYLYFYALDGATKKYSISLNKATDSRDAGRYSLSISEYKGDNTSHLGSYFNPSHFEIVDMTKDNWDTYFEIFEHYSYGTNSFDEVNSVNIHRQFRLKKEYRSRLWSIPGEVAVEYTSLIGKQPCEFDLKNKTCKLTGKFEPNQENGKDKVYTNSHKMSYWGDSSTPESGDEYYGYEFSSNTGQTKDDGSQYFSWLADNVKVTRVQGKLYLLKEEFQKMGASEE